MVASNEGSENKGSNGGELDEDVDGWAGGILEGVSNGITDDSGNLAFLEDELSVDEVEEILVVLRFEQYVEFSILHQTLYCHKWKRAKIAMNHCKLR